MTLQKSFFVITWIITQSASSYLTVKNGYTVTIDKPCQHAIWHHYKRKLNSWNMLNTPSKTKDRLKASFTSNQELTNFKSLLNLHTHQITVIFKHVWFQNLWIPPSLYKTILDGRRFFEVKYKCADARQLGLITSMK